MPGRVIPGLKKRAVMRSSTALVKFFHEDFRLTHEKRNECNSADTILPVPENFFHAHPASRRPTTPIGSARSFTLPPAPRPRDGETLARILLRLPGDPEVPKIAL